MKLLSAAAAAASAGEVSTAVKNKRKEPTRFIGEVGTFLFPPSPFSSALFFCFMRK